MLDNVLSVISAGWMDGNRAEIYKNDTQIIPTNILVGHHVCIFDRATLEFVDYKLFNIKGVAGDDEKYINFLDTLSSEYLLAIAISSDGDVSNAALREKIRGIGSKYIDSLQLASSWSIMGYKGASQGSVPEKYTLATNGVAAIDTIIPFLADGGSMLTSEIGFSGNWKKIIVNQETPSNSTIAYTPVGINEDGELDTLAQLNLHDSIADLSHIDAKYYTKIKILADFVASNDNQSPILESLGVDYDMIPELATNYQVVSLEKDTLQQGEDANLSFYVYNVGESTADSFKVTVDVVKPDNSKERVFEELIDSIGTEKRKKFNISYNTNAFNGARTFSISIDSEDKVLELYEDNNFYNIPFFVIGDTTKPTMNLTFDGNDLFDGEYISAQPKIKVELSEPSLIPITDTSSIIIFLNNSYINYKGNEEVINVNYSETNPKVTVDYTPTLEDGEYTLRVFGKDASGNIGDSAGISKSFNVQSDAQLLNVYNYPNPFSNDTYFTFKLTQIPDEIKIKVFTVAGRLIKEIILNSSQLNYDLNKVYWDGRDVDGDVIGNGVYLYKVIMDVAGKKQDVIQKLAIVR